MSVVAQWLGHRPWNLRVVSLILTGSPHLTSWESCLPKVGLGSLTRKMSTWPWTVYHVHVEKLFGSTGIYSPQGSEMVLECSGLMIAREVIVKRL